MARRSVLFSPGDDRAKLEGALASSADAVVFDLEDGVAPSDKSLARTTIAEVVAEAGTARPEVGVRINPLEDGGQADLEALAPVGDAFDGLVLPKVGDPGDVTAVATVAADRSLPAALWCLIESPDGLLNASAIAEVEGTTALVFGGEDYAASIGAERTDAGTELLFARQYVVAAAARVGIDAIDGISSVLDDPTVIRHAAREARTFGFDGKLAIHPAQIDPIHAAFAPDPDQLAWARRVLAVAEETDRGVFRVDDEMIDAPLIERARQLVERADADVTE